MKKLTRYAPGFSAICLGLVLFAAAAAAANTYQWNTATVDADGDPGFYNSLAFDPAGDPAIGYIDLATAKVRFAHRQDDTWSSEEVGSETDSIVSVAMSPTSGRGGVAFRTGQKMVFADEENGWTPFQEVFDRVFPESGSLAYDSAGNPAIAFRYKQKGQDGLRYAWWDGGAWQSEVVDAGAGARYHSLAFRPPPNEHPAIAYSDDVDDDGYLDTLKYAYRDESGWTIEAVRTGVRGYGVDASLAFDPTADAAIVHKVSLYDEVQFLDRTGSDSWSDQVVDSGSGLRDPSLAFASSGTAFVAYRFSDGSGPLDDEIRVAVGDPGITPTPWPHDVVDVLPYFVGDVSVAVGPAGLPAVSYHAKDPASSLLFAEAQLLQACGGPEECDDGNECTDDACIDGFCQYSPAADDTPCGADGICCGGTCSVATCSTDADCDDGDSCTTDDACQDPGSCAASCTYQYVACGFADGCCGPGCDPSNDPDCCGASGSSCTVDADCCSNKCKGKPGRKTCS